MEPPFTLKTYVACAAVFWLLIFSAISYSLVYGSEKSKQQNSEIVGLFLLLAWTSTIGWPLYEWVKSWFN